ncbi:MAG: efflux RND transporter periplasmic adaptor subunit [Bacteroidetes bacterium]|nr:efflux RND transporter periplasmic adaptor subunit [Bacteroidota bacterium]
MNFHKFHLSEYILPAIATFLMYGCMGSGKDGAKEATNVEKIVPVEVIKLEPDTFTRILTFTGTILPWQETKFGAQSPGRVENIYVEEGSRVTAGDLLVQMDDAQLKQARIQYLVAESNFFRMDTLLKAGSVSQQQYDNVKAQYESARTSHELILKNTQLRSPFSGIVTGKFMNEGEVYTMAPSVQAGGAAAIVSIQQINPAKILVSASEKDFPILKPGMNATVTVDIYAGREFTGTVSRIFPTINPLSRTFNAEIRIPNNDEQLRPGMFARVRIEAGEVTGLLIPKYALLTQPGTSHKFCFTAVDSVAVRKNIELGQDIEERAELLSGLNAGDYLVVNGQAALKDGMKVKSKQP